MELSYVKDIFCFGPSYIVNSLIEIDHTECVMITINI